MYKIIVHKLTTPTFTFEYESPVIPQIGESIGNDKWERGEVSNVWHRVVNGKFSHIDIYLRIRN